MFAISSTTLSGSFQISFDLLKTCATVRPLGAGASALGVGGYLTDPKLNLAEVTARAQKLTEIARTASRVSVPA